MTSRPLRVLFLMSHAGHARNFESTLRALGDRGHAVSVAVDHVKPVPGSDTGGARLLESIGRDYPNVSSLEAPRVTSDAQAWLDVARGARLGLDCLRYLEPPFRETPKLTTRAFGRLRGPLRPPLEFARTGSQAYRESLRRALTAVHEGVPPVPLYLDFIRAQAPDVVLVTPLVALGSHQHEQVRAARALGVSVVFLVHSWDNLTTKGLIHLSPDLVAVWNEAQRREAIDLHGIEPERVVATGAPAWDHWFDWEPSTTREEFCAKLDLDVRRPFVVYLGSSAFIAPGEAEAVLEWVKGIRSAPSAEVRDVGIVVRPHPTNPLRGDEPAQRGLEERDDVVLYPRDGQNPTDSESRQDYFDSLFHSAAVVGVNTSAFLESSILGRPAHTILWPHYRETQKGTVHFRYLTDPSTGLLHVAVSAREHAQQLHASLVSPEAGARSKGFVEFFIRPLGRDVPATPLLIDAIERASASRRHGSNPPAIRRLAAWSVRNTVRGAGRASLGSADPLHAAGRRLKQLVRHAPEDAAISTVAKAPSRAKKPKPPIVAAAPETLAAHRSVRQQVDNARREPVPALVRDKIDRAEHAARARLAALADSGEPVIAGPWTGEVGFELLYWIPLLAWAVRVEPRIAKSLHVVSRGGADPWYAHLSTRYADVLDLSSHDEYLERRTPQKQRRETEYESELLLRAQKYFAVDSAVGLHPSLLFKLYFGGVKNDRMIYVRSVLADGDDTHGWTSDYAPLSISSQGRPEWLPERFLAVRFYHRESFDVNVRTLRFINETVAALANVTDIVLLGSGGQMDEHLDALISRGRIHRMDDHVERRNNLAQQTEVIAYSDGFVGTYGGLAYLPPMLGIPSLGFSSTTTGLQPWHDALATRLFESNRWGAYSHHHIDALTVDRIVEMCTPQAVRSR